MNSLKQIKQPWWREVLRLQKIVATVILISFSAGLVHSDIDLDGIPDAVDPFPETPVQAPRILFPAEDAVVYAPSREVAFTGTAEVGSQIKLFEDGITQELSCQEANASVVQGTGLLVSKTGGGSNVDQVSLLTGAMVVAQTFYNTTTDSAPTLWRSNLSASWATEQIDDAIDGICNYQAGGAPEDRCGSVIFPEQVIVLATGDRVYLFDAQLRTFWKSLPVSGATSVVAENGNIFIGTATGVLVWDFAEDNFSKSFTNQLPGGAIVSLDTVSVGAVQYLLVATANGTAVVNIATDDIFTSTNTGTIVGAAFTSSNRILWATSTAIQISSDPVDLLANNWTSIDLSATARFPFSSPGTVTAVASDLIGLTTGVARIFDDGEGNVLIQHVTRTTATLPMGVSSRGHWLETGATEAIDMSVAGKDLDNVLSVTSVPAGTGADVDIFQFGGADRYLKSKNETDFSITGKHLTIGAWVRRPDFGGSGPFKKLLSHGEGDAPGEWDYWLSAGENFFEYGLNADPYFFGLRTTDGEKGASAFTFALNKWQLLVGTYDGETGEMKMYLDGEEQDQNILFPGINSVPLTGDISMVDKELRLGWGYAQEYFNGDMALPFIAAETYSPEQVALLYQYSNGWFAPDTTTTLRGTSNIVSDVTCDRAHKECFVLTDDGIVTRIDGNLFSGGITSLVTGVTNVSDITPTYLGTWQCTHAFDTSGAYAVFAQTYWNNDPTAINSELRNFTVFAQAEQTLVAPLILPFPDEFISQGNATVLWSTEEITEDYFVAQIATDPSFQIGTREQRVRGHSARFDALADMQTYYCRVKAQNNLGGASDWSEIISVTVDSSAPTVGIVENQEGRISSQEEIHFSWETRPFSDIGSGILWYDMEISTDQTFADDVQRVVKNDRLAATNYTFTGVQGETYFARVRAMDAVGHWSAWAEGNGTLMDTTAPEAFSLNSLATTAGTEVRLNWTTSVDLESQVVAYEIWQKENNGEYVLLTSTGTEGRTYKVSGLQDGATYSFKIIAKNGAQLSFETPAQEILINSTQLTPPQWLSSPYSSSKTVTLEWSVDKDFSAATHYQIFRQGVLMGTVTADTTIFTDPVVHANGEVFLYQVRAFSPATVENPQDTAGVFSPELRVLVDPTKPVFDGYEILGPSAINTWRNRTFSFRLWGTDGTNIFDPASSNGNGFSSGLDGTSFREGTIAPFAPHNVPILLTESGSHDFQFKFRDRAGNEIAPMNIANVKLDKISPTAVIRQSFVSEEIFTQQNGFISTNTLPYQITATDTHSGVNTYEISYRLDKNGDGFFRSSEGDSNWSSWSAVVGANGTLSVPGDGVLELRAAVTDVAGNRTISDIFSVKIDRQAPQAFSTPPIQPIAANTTIQLNASDMPVVASGFDTMYYTKNGADPKSSLFPVRREGTTVLIEPATDAPGGIFTIKYYATDTAGNESETHISTNGILDSDSDGLPDWWETLYGGTVAPESDGDGDTVTALQEFYAHTDPTNIDTDGDGAIDGAEKAIATDPLNGTDHLFQWISPEAASTVRSTFTIIGTATPGAIAEVYDTVDSSFLGTATVDPRGRFAMEVSGLSGGAHVLQVTFQYPKNPLAVIASELQNIIVDNSGADQPQITNLLDGAQIGPSTTRIEVSHLTGNSTVELFEILDNVLYSISTTETTATGTADIWLPRRSEERRIFVLDHTTWKTSEIVSFEQGIFIEGIVYDEDGVPLEGATVELTDSQNSSISGLSAADGTYHIFASPNQEYAFRAEATGFFPEEQALTTGFIDIRVNVFLMEIDRQVSLSGVVSDSDGALLSGVSIQIVAGAMNFSATTDSVGAYSIQVPASTTYTATFALLDHDTHVQSIEVLRHDVQVNVTLVRQELAVLVSGQVLSSGNALPLLGGIVHFVSNQNEVFETQTDAAGSFSLSLRRDRNYTVQFTLAGYTSVSQTFPLVATPLVLPTVYLTALQEEVAGGGQSAIRGWSGRQLNNPEDEISDDWIPSMTYEESMEQVRRLNAGIAGQVKVIEKNGEELFAGYIAGRIGVDNFREGEDSKKLSITAFGDRVQEMHASAKIGYCLSYQYTTMDFRDVQIQSKWYPAVAKVYSLGQMPLDKEFKFRPTEMLGWETALEMVFAVRCMQPDSFDILRSFKQDQWENFSLQNTLPARRAYTALDMGLVSYEDDLTKSPTRERLLQLWMKVFDVPVDSAAVQTSFADVPVSHKSAPLLVAARKLDLIPTSKNFRPDALIPRSEAAQWFISFFDAEREDRIDRTEQQYQFDDHKVATGREVTADDQVRAAMLQKEVAEERRLRISEIVPVTDDLNIEGNSGFVRRQGEDRETFLKRLAEAKATAEKDPRDTILDYDALRQKSLETRGIIEKEVESKIQTSDTSGFVRRQDETREEFLARLSVAKQELKTKQAALQSDATMKASAPKAAGPVLPTQNLGKLKIEIDTDRTCNIKMAWETTESFQERCGNIRDESKESAYKNMFDSFKKRTGIQETVEPVEVTVKPAAPTKDTPTLTRSKMDVALRRMEPELEKDEQTAKIKTRQPQSDL